MIPDITNLFLGSVFAMFIALLAWGNQFSQPRKEITELEELFRKEYNLTSKNKVKISKNNDKYYLEPFK